MADITYAELKSRIGNKLSLVSVSEDLSAEDEAEIGKRCLSVQAQLDNANIASFAVEYGLEEGYSDAFADLVAAECADVFDLPEPKRSMVASQKFGLPGRSPAERRLRAMFISTKPVIRTDVTVV
jgi:hypothetical protein